MKAHAKADQVSRIVRKFGDKKKAAYVAGPKVRGICQLESNLEATGLAVGAIDPRITSMRPQPMTLDVLSGRQYASKKALMDQFSGCSYSPKPYTPDLLVCHHGDLETYIEIKHSRLIEENPDILEMPGVFVDLGMRLLIVTEQILSDALAHNARMLRPYLRHTFLDADRDKILQTMQGGMTFRELTQNDVPQASIFKAILDGTVSVDLQHKRLSPKSALKPAHGRTAHLEILPL